MKKRIISIMLIICMVMTTLLPEIALAGQELATDNASEKAASQQITNFKDVSQSDWYYNSVKYALEHNIFNGTGNDTFSPNGTMTRGMYVTIMGRIAGVIPSDYAGKVGFADVDKDAYYAPYVAWAVKNGITSGVGNNGFDPDGIVNREQMATFTIRYFDAYDIDYGASTDVTTKPGDLSGVSDWAQDAVLKLWKAGLIKGDDDGNFNPKNNATRVEAATFSMRTNERVETWKEEKAAEPTSMPLPNNGTSGSTGGTGGGSTIHYTVTFDSNGGTDVASVSVIKGRTLSSLPSPQKTNAIFLGWYTDSSLQGDKFSEEDTINSNITLYAKYMVIEGAPELEQDDSYALADQESDLTFTIVASDSSMTANTVKSGITLETMDGSEAVNLEVTGSNGVFSVTANGGFTEGASYKLTLNDDVLGFSGKNDTIRTCSFTIKKQESFNLEMNEGIIYIPSSDLSNIIKNGTEVDALSVPLVKVTDNESGNKESNTGTFTYNGGNALKTGDVLCIYSGAKPEVGDDAPYLDDDIAYIQVTNVNGTTVGYSDADSKKVLFLPDVLPIYAGEDNELTNYISDTTSGSFSISISDLDFSEFSEMGLNADTTIDKGDYLALYTTSDLSHGTDSDVTYGKVTSVTSDGETLSVAFTKTTKSDMKESLDYYSKNNIDGNTLLEGVNVQALKEKIKQQVFASGFANKAAVCMIKAAMSTEGFKKLAGDGANLESYSILMPDGSKADMSKFKLMAEDGSGIEDLHVNVDISDDTEELSDGVRCAVEVSFNIPVDTGNNTAVNISMTATFVEELDMSVNASAETEWDYLWGFIPYISEYKVSADIDVYDFTGISLNATVKSASDTQVLDISQEIQDILAYTKTSDITAGVQDLFETYGNMMENESDWITIFTQNISESTQSLLLGVVQIKTSVDFVVSANINVALGLNFEYKSGTRYSFWADVIAMDAGSSTLDLMDETYDFQFYVMGSLGLRAGICLEFSVGLFSTDLDSVGLTAEAGVYTNLYGYFFYEVESVNGVKKSKKSGALYVELGCYLEINFKAQVLTGTFQYNPTLYSGEWPLLTVGDRYDVYDFAYKNTDGISLKDKVRVYTLPDSMFDMTYLDLKEGDISKKTYSVSDYDITFSNSNFGRIGNKVLVNVPDNIHLMKCDMTVRWKDSSLAFSSIPIARTFHLIWDDLDDGGYTITFDSNGGSGVSSITKKFGAIVTAPNPPTKTGYTFDGWYSDEQLTKAYTFSRMGWEDITLYAKWTANTNTAYKVNHHQQDVANSSSYVLYKTESFTGTTGVAVTPDVKNYTGFTAPSTQTVTITADGSREVNYYYTRNSYTLTFKPVNGGDDIVKTVKYGASISAPSVTKTGYTFNGWNPVAAATMPAVNTTYTAQWTANTYTVSFDSNSGSSCNSIAVTNGSAYGVLPVPTRTGYTFNGWYTIEIGDNGTGTQITSTTTASIASVQTLYAKWTAKTNTAYTVKHYQQNLADNNYTLYETQNLTGATGGSITPAVKNYTGFTAPSTQTVTIIADGSRVVNYNYTRNSYTLTFDANGGTGGTSNSVKYGAAISAPTVTRTGYTFNGWNPAVVDTMPAANTTYTAQWTANENIAYTVNHYQQNLDDEDYTLHETENLTGTADVDVTPAVKNYTGFTAPSAQTVSILADGSTEINYNYTRNSYILTFDANGGTGGTSESVKYGASIDAPTVTSAVYTFYGWDPAVADTMPGEDTTYIAQWTGNGNAAYAVNHYQQNLDDENYTLYETGNLTGTIGADVTPAVKNYAGFTAPSTQTVTVTGDGSRVVNYNYTRNSYTLTFDANGGIGGTSESVKYGASIDAPTVTRAVYTFDGWDPVVVDTMPDHDTTYTAQWTIGTKPFGAGTLEDPYLIASFANLKWVSANNAANTGFSGKYFKQTADIDMSPTTSETWIPIGNMTNKFNGTYDGNGYSVENLCINTAAIRQGLFGVIGNAGTVTDLGVTNVDITCSAHNNTTGAMAGALVGTSYGSILRCYSTGTVSGDGNTGGLLGYSHGGTIKDCYSRCTVLGNGASVAEAYAQVGGLLGKLALVSGMTGSVSNSYATGNVTAANHDDVGGLAGEIDTDQEVYSSFATSTVIGSTNVGGIAGVLQGPMYNAYTTSGTFKGSVGGTITGGNTGVALSWFKDISNFTTSGNWHATHQWDFDNTWAIDPSINDGLPYLQKSKLGR
ncbi:MAG: InlB B-repeat-containing protein [Ignavibacteriales bacterium]